ncbi:MAG: metallophosphoesterase [Clostridia bacterium]|nr:metallophosphoesterase [Clostridia bacterium]
MKTVTVPGTTKAAKRNHRFLRILIRILIIAVLLAVFICAAVLGYSRYTQTHYEISFYQESSRKVSSNIRIIVVSDLHNREYGEHNGTLVSDIRAMKPDLILLPGDMVILDEEDYRPMLDLVSELSGIAPCYGVLGNHESERIYYRDDRELPAKFENAGLKLLRNASENVRIGNDTIQLIGVEGTTHGFEAYGGRAFMDQCVIDPSAYSILMAHIPVLFEPQLSAYDFDLGIAGHVHGGIVKLPFLGGLYSAEEGLFPRFTMGRYILQKQQKLIISGGLGDSKPFPPRINNMPELVVIDINKY